MKAILSKEAGGYDLYRIDEDGKRVTFASTQDYKQKLSLKNCQAIERGFDLDELISESDTSHLTLFTSDSHELMYDEGFKAGFQKAIELMGDKKFSEKDMKYCWNQALKFEPVHITFGVCIELLQQTEWDVEIVTFTEDDLKSVSEDWGKLGKPKLDTDGCLILKTFKSE